MQISARFWNSHRIGPNKKCISVATTCQPTQGKRTAKRRKVSTGIERTRLKAYAFGHLPPAGGHTFVSGCSLQSCGRAGQT